MLEFEKIDVNIWLTGIEFVLVERVGVMLFEGSNGFDDDKEAFEETIDVLFVVIVIDVAASFVFKATPFSFEIVWYFFKWSWTSFGIVLILDKLLFELLWWFPTNVESLARSGIDEIKLSWLLNVTVVDIDACVVETEFKSDESETDLISLDGVDVREPLAEVFCLTEFVGVVESVWFVCGDFVLIKK